MADMVLGAIQIAGAAMLLGTGLFFERIRRQMSK